MRIVLQHNVDQLGIIGDVVTVKNGYARNYLIPRGLAMPASRRNIKVLEHHARILERRREKVLAEAQSFADRVEGAVVTFERNAGGEGKLFGSVSSKDIEAELLKQDLMVSRRQIVLKEPIKAVGTFEIAVRIHTQLRVNIKVVVAAASGSGRAAVSEAPPEEPPPVNAETEAEEEDGYDEE